MKTKNRTILLSLISTATAAIIVIPPAIVLTQNTTKTNDSNTFLQNWLNNAQFVGTSTVLPSNITTSSQISSNISLATPANTNISLQYFLNDNGNASPYNDADGNLSIIAQAQYNNNGLIYNYQKDFIVKGYATTTIYNQIISPQINALKQSFDSYYLNNIIPSAPSSSASGFNLNGQYGTTTLPSQINNSNLASFLTGLSGFISLSQNNSSNNNFTYNNLQIIPTIESFDNTKGSMNITFNFSYQLNNFNVSFVVSNITINGFSNNANQTQLIANQNFLNNLNVNTLMGISANITNTQDLIPSYITSTLINNAFNQAKIKGNVFNNDMIKFPQSFIELFNVEDLTTLNINANIGTITQQSNIDGVINMTFTFSIGNIKSGTFYSKVITYNPNNNSTTNTAVSGFQTVYNFNNKIIDNLNGFNVQLIALNNGLINAQIISYVGINKDNITIPSSILWNGQNINIVSIGASAFASKYLTGTIVIPSSIVSIGASAFANNKITSVSFHTSNLANSQGQLSSLTSIGASAFANNNIAFIQVEPFVLQYLNNIGASAFANNNMSLLNIAWFLNNKISQYQIISIGSGAFLANTISQDGYPFLPTNSPQNNVNNNITLNANINLGTNTIIEVFGQNNNVTIAINKN